MAKQQALTGKAPANQDRPGVEPPAPYPTTAEERRQVDTSVIRESLAVLPIVAIEEIV